MLVMGQLGELVVWAVMPMVRLLTEQPEVGGHEVVGVGLVVYAVVLVGLIVYAVVLVGLLLVLQHAAVELVVALVVSEAPEGSSKGWCWLWALATLMVDPLTHPTLRSRSWFRASAVERSQLVTMFKCRTYRCWCMFSWHFQSHLLVRQGDGGIVIPPHQPSATLDTRACVI